MKKKPQFDKEIREFECNVFGKNPEYHDFNRHKCTDGDRAFEYVERKLKKMYPKEPFVAAQKNTPNMIFFHVDHKLVATIKWRNAKDVPPPDKEILLND